MKIPKELTRCARLLFLCVAIFLQAFSFAQGQPASSPVTKVGEIEHYALIEASGLAASERLPGIFWTHNDNDTPSFLFAITQTGAYVGAYEVQGAALIDWEAVAYNEGSVYLADIGTNGMARTHSAIHRVEEPSVERRWGPAKVLDTWYIRFPRSREDCESFFIHNGYGYLVGKYPFNRSVSLYRFSLADRSTSVLLEAVGRIPSPSPVSDATVSADGNRLAVLTENGVTVFFIAGEPASAFRAFRVSSPYRNNFLEGAAFVGNRVLALGEAIPDILLFNDLRLTGTPLLTQALTNQSAFTGVTIELRVAATGFPPPTFEWRFNGQLIPGETNSVLTLTNLPLQNAGSYEVTIANTAGVVRSAGNVTVLERVTDVRVTEAMASEAPNTLPTEDWWELTNFGTEEVDLIGWRFNDSTGGILDAFVVPTNVVIQPGESVVFVENLTPEEFRAWWGPSNFTTNSQIVTYSGPTLSFSALGDVARVWDNRATDDSAVIASASFGASEVGVSFTYDPVTEQFGARSQVGVNGAFRAATSEDVGSPGRIVTEPGVVLTAELAANSIEIRMTGDAREAYTLESSEDLQHWTPAAGEFSDSADGAVILERASDANVRFYRVRKN